MGDYVLEIDQLINERYRIQAPRGFGSYGVVWRAWHTYLDRPVAIKEISGATLDAETRARVLRECQIGGKLGDTPHIVPVLDAFEYRQALLIVMAFMEGGTLDKRLHETVPFVLALDWAIDLIAGLDRVHAAGIIHRDIKPQNILLDAHGAVYISDFGIAHIDRSHLTEGRQPGTKLYKAPELETASAATPAADVYSLAAVLFQLWTGQLYADLAGYPTDVVREEFLALLASAHPGVTMDVRIALADAVLAGLRPLDQRINLTGLTRQLQAIKSQLSGARELSTAAAEAQAQIVAAVRPVPGIMLRPSDGDTSQGTALVEWAANDIERSFRDELWEGTRRTLFFWYDEAMIWRPLLAELAQRVNLIIDTGSLLEMRYELERRNESEPVVVYLQRNEQQLGYLRPYQPLARTITLDPLDLLLKQGITLSSLSKERSGIIALLPDLIQASRGRGTAFWHRINSVESARSALLGDAREMVQQFMIDPAGAWAVIDERGQGQLFVQEIANRFGYSAPESEAPALAAGLFSSWCLVQVFEEYNQAASYPFKSALPAPRYWANCSSALRQLRFDNRAQDCYEQYCRQFEQKYAGLLRWAESQEITPADPALPGLALLAWQRTKDLVSSWDTRDAVIAGVRSHLERFRQQARGFWATRGAAPGWSLLVQASNIIGQAEECRIHAELLTEPAAFIEAYTTRWARLDRDYRLYRASNDVAEVSPLHTWVDVYYRRYLERANQGWTQAIATGRQWPPAGVGLPQSALWGKIAQGRQRRAIFFIDALRYDLALELWDELRKAEQSELQPVLAGLPSITALGMSALLPEAERQQVDWSGDWQVVLSGLSLNLARKEDRGALLEQHLNGLRQMSLAELVRPRTKVPGAPWLAVFSSEIDSWGENSSQLAFDAMTGYVQRLAQGIRKVLDAGYEVAHVVTDHGFLMLSDVGDTDKVPVPLANSLKRDQRYILGRDLPEQAGLLRFAVRGSTNLGAYYTQGIASFVSTGSYHYSHGGLSLQEVIVPYLVIKRVAQVTPVGVQINAPEILHNAVFRIQLAAVQRDLFEQEPREVRLTIERSDGNVIMHDELTIGVATPVQKMITLLPIHGVTFGSRLTIIIRDAQTGEELDRAQPLVQVSLDLL